MPDDRIPNLSVVIVTYNNELEITACLASALHAAKDVTCEIIIIDNGSKDGTRNKIAEVISNDQKSRVELVVNTQNLGFTKALNQGLRKSCGEFILALNPDTTLQPASLTILMQTLQEDTKTGLIAPQLLNTDGTVQPSCRRFPRRRDVFFEITGLSLLFPKSRFFNSWKMGDFDHKHRSYVEQPQGACLLFKRQLLTDIGFWDESFPMFFSDVDWCQRVKSAGYEILFEPAARVIHYKGQSVRQIRPLMIWSSHVSFYTYFKKHAKSFTILNELLRIVLFFTALMRMVRCFLRKG